MSIIVSWKFQVIFKDDINKLMFMLKPWFPTENTSIGIYPKRLIFKTFVMFFPFGLFHKYLFPFNITFSRIWITIKKFLSICLEPNYLLLTKYWLSLKITTRKLYIQHLLRIHLFLIQPPILILIFLNYWDINREIKKGGSESPFYFVTDVSNSPKSPIAMEVAICSINI